MSGIQDHNQHVVHPQNSKCSLLVGKETISQSFRCLSSKIGEIMPAVDFSTRTSGKFMRLTAKREHTPPWQSSQKRGVGGEEWLGLKTWAGGFLRQLWKDWLGRGRIYDTVLFDWWAQWGEGPEESVDEQASGLDKKILFCIVTVLFQHKNQNACFVLVLFSTGTVKYVGFNNNSNT